MRILIDVANDRLGSELVDLLQRAGHQLERGAARAGKAFDVALVATADAAERLRREVPHAAIIVVTKVDDVPARIRALDAGADDAFDASFPPMQMMSRVGAAGRRAAAVPRPPEVLLAGGLAIDLQGAIASRPGASPIALTAREVDILRHLARHANAVVSRADLLQHVWKVAPGNETRAVDVAIATLRGKLGDEVIVSVRGVGYKLVLTNG